LALLGSLEMTPPRRRLLGPALMTVIMLATLIGLGVWQLHRRTWKLAKLATIHRAAISPAVPLPMHPTEFQKVGVTGVLRPDLAVLYGDEVIDTPQGTQMGGQLIEPLMRSAGPPVLVDRGWVPAQPSAPVSTPSGAISIEGYIRPAEHPKLFTPKNDLPGRRFYTLDPQVIGAAMGLPKVAPFVVVVLGSPASVGYPIPATEMPTPPNNHLQYALTWFGLAGVLLIIFINWARAALNPTAEQNDGRL
jgi:surfeit locus 1 family protein